MNNDLQEKPDNLIFSCCCRILEITLTTFQEIPHAFNQKQVNHVLIYSELEKNRSKTFYSKNICAFINGIKFWCLEEEPGLMVFEYCVDLLFVAYKRIH